MAKNPKFPIDTTRYNVAYFHSKNGAIRIPEPVAFYIEELEDTITDRNTQLKMLSKQIQKLNGRTLWQRLTNKGVK